MAMTPIKERIGRVLTLIYGAPVPWDGQDFKRVERAAHIRNVPHRGRVSQVVKEVSEDVFERHTSQIEQYEVEVLNFGVESPSIQLASHTIPVRDKMREQGLSLEGYEWYFEMLQSGVPPSAGFGLGVERLTRYICGVEKIWEATAFPKVPGLHSP